MSVNRMSVNRTTSKVVEAFTKAVETYGTEVEFRLTDGTMFIVKATDINRIPSDLSDGLQQDRITMRVMGEGWHRVAGPDRRPQKGDMVISNGVRHLIDNARPVRFGGSLIAYVLTLRG